MTRDPGLRHPQDLQPLLDGELLPLQEADDPLPGGVGEGLEDLLEPLDTHVDPSSGNQDEWILSFPGRLAMSFEATPRGNKRGRC